MMSGNESSAQSDSAVCRWGILGTAGIARKNWHAIQLAPNAKLQAVASRSVGRAEQFIAECQAQVAHDVCPEAIGSYETLLAKADIDAVYIPLPTAARKEWVIRAAQAGKHVLCEKPIAVSAADAREMLDACQANDVQFMDGVMFMHSERFQRICEAVQHDDELGQLRRIASHHSFLGDQEFFETNIRLNSSLEPHGALGDLGWYSIRMILSLLDAGLPEKVSGRIIKEVQRADSPAAVPVEFSAELFFRDVSASFYCAFNTENQQWVNIGGTKGYLLEPDFVLPFHGSELTAQLTKATFDIQGCQFDMHPNRQVLKVTEAANNASTAQEAKMFEAFSNLVITKQLDPAWSEIAMKTQQVMDACLKSAHQQGELIEV